jgi:hypothetical protein
MRNRASESRRHLGGTGETVLAGPAGAEDTELLQVLQQAGRGRPQRRMSPDEPNVGRLTAGHARWVSRVAAQVAMQIAEVATVQAEVEITMEAAIEVAVVSA